MIGYPNYLILILVFLVSCENSKSPELTNPITKDETFEDSLNLKKKEVDLEIFSQGYWIGKNYYDLLINGELTSLFIDNHLTTYVDENQAQLEIGNSYGSEPGKVSISNDQFYFEPSHQEDNIEYSFRIAKGNNYDILATNFYWGIDYEEELIKDTIYIKIGEDTEENRHNGFYQVGFPIELLYFSGEYEVVDKKNGKEYPNVEIKDQYIHNLFDQKSRPYSYESIFPGVHVIYIAQEEQYSRDYFLDGSKRVYYLPSERRYFIVEDTESGFLLYDLLQPSLDNPKGCIEAHDIESEAKKGELLFVFTKKK
ncbi:MAG: hypothetical protein GY810_17745 [Aureispira sp.]|nr:hypothetical protein [Aureispira sp.]